MALQASIFFLNMPKIQFLLNLKIFYSFLEFQDFQIVIVHYKMSLILRIILEIIRYLYQNHLLLKFHFQICQFLLYNLNTSLLKYF